LDAVHGLLEQQLQAPLICTYGSSARVTNKKVGFRKAGKGQAAGRKF
jgi:hypothetical protein